MTSSKHQSILVTEVIEIIAPTASGTYLDATFGGGGHSRAMLEASSPDGRVIGIDRDENVVEYAETLVKEYGSRFEFQPISYADMNDLDVKFDGIVFDLGLSSDQLETSGRGFSFQKADEPLDLRFEAHGQTAAQFLSQAPLPEIERIFRDYAEDRYWKLLARKITASRRQKPIRTVSDFIAVVGNSNPKVLAPLFQALRIEVNRELETLKIGLNKARDQLKPGGRIAVISFHSLEDRIVKEFLRQEQWEVLTKKPIVPQEDEIAQNPRSRSAKLRGAIRI